MEHEETDIQGIQNAKQVFELPNRDSGEEKWCISNNTSLKVMFAEEGVEHGSFPTQYVPMNLHRKSAQSMAGEN